MMHILYIEDELAEAQLVERVAQAERHQGIIVNDIQQARDVLQETAPDLILVDIILNRVKVGDEFVQELRTQGYVQPIIAITGAVLPEEIQYYRSIGFTEVLTKPYQISQLVDLLERYSTAHQQR